MHTIYQIPKSYLRIGYSQTDSCAFAPTGDICVYIHLLVICTCTLTTKFFVFTFPWMKYITARLSAKFRQALPINNLCTLYTTFQNPTSKLGIFNQAVMHNCYKTLLKAMHMHACGFVCAHYISHSKLLIQNRLFSIKQLCTTVTKIIQTHGYACMRLCFYRLPHPALHCQNRW